jgi:hypothetical protein
LGLPSAYDWTYLIASVDSAAIICAFVLMEHAPKSLRKGAEPLFQTHHLIAEILPELQPAEMQTVYFRT